MVLGIDPSFSSTGLALVDCYGVCVASATVKAPNMCYGGNDSIHEACDIIISGILDFIDANKTHLADSELEVMLEVPALATRSGAYLAILHGRIVSILLLRGMRVYTCPCTACDSFIKNSTHSKTYIVTFCKTKGWVENKRINNDVCTAVVLSNILISWKKKQYVNKVWVLKTVIK